MTSYEIISVLAKLIEDKNAAIITAVKYGESGMLSASDVADILFNEFTDFLEERNA